eukprot:scaffold161320_cov35-Tisochrysis_lutea.AAC.1
MDTRVGRLGQSFAGTTSCSNASCISRATRASTALCSQMRTRNMYDLNMSAGNRGERKDGCASLEILDRSRSTPKSDDAPAPGPLHNGRLSYKLAHRLRDPSSFNAVVEEITQTIRRPVPGALSKRVYQHVYVAAQHNDRPTHVAPLHTFSLHLSGPNGRCLTEHSQHTPCLLALPLLLEPLGAPRLASRAEPATIFTSLDALLACLSFRHSLVNGHAVIGTEEGLPR